MQPKLYATPNEADAALALAAGPPSWLDAVDHELAELSWDRTWAQMAALIETTGVLKASARGQSIPSPQRQWREAPAKREAADD